MLCKYEGPMPGTLLCVLQMDHTGEHETPSYVYGEEVERIAQSRGWNMSAHSKALAVGDEDRITLTHPINLLTEAEAETYFH